MRHYTTSGVCCALALASFGVPVPSRAQEKLPVAAVERFAALALDCIHQEYPNKIAHVLQGDADVRPP